MVVMAERWLQLPLDIIHLVFKSSCTNWTAIDPSPTAEATRLTEPERTSPAANTPGRLVSNKNGCRFKVQCPESPSSIPVRTKCFSSFSISDGNQSVRGVAPMKLKRAAVAKVLFLPVVLFTSRWRYSAPVAMSKHLATTFSPPSNSRTEYTLSKVNLVTGVGIDMRAPNLSA